MKLGLLKAVTFELQLKTILPGQKSVDKPIWATYVTVLPYINSKRPEQRKTAKKRCGGICAYNPIMQT